MLHYKLPIDRVPLDFKAWRSFVREQTFKRPWFETYDLIEFVLCYYRFFDEEDRVRFIKSCNLFMERELSAYRIVDGLVARLTSEEEIAAVEEALTNNAVHAPVTTHLGTALKHLSNREAPDYRNSIKESISAVESMCGIIVGKKTTLSDALKQIEAKGVKIHPALRDGFLKIYGYTSDASGIRHALSDQPTVDFEDAKFMLVSCSAFVNLLRARVGT